MAMLSSSVRLLSLAVLAASLYAPKVKFRQNGTDMGMAKMYLSLLQGSATHMGCGFSKYFEQYFKYMGDTLVTKPVYNTIHLVCNLSHNLRTGTPSYETDPPIPGQGYSPKCGCPPGFQEDADCLCVEGKSTPPEPCPYGENSGYDCDSSLVLLPIFTMEDAPPNKLYQVPEEIKDPLKNYVLQRVDNTSNAIERKGNMVYTLSSLEMSGLFHDKEDKKPYQRAREPLGTKKSKIRVVPQLYHLDSEPPPTLPRKFSGLKPPTPARSPPRGRLLPPPPPPRIPPPPPPSLNAHEETRPATSMRNRPLPKLPPKRRGETKKSSIFTKVAQFQLPNRRNIPSPRKVIKKDVAPRKDFSNLNKVVNDYLKRRPTPGYKITNSNHEQYKSKNKTTPHTEEKTHTEVVFDTGLNNAEDTVINVNQYLSQKNNSNYIDPEVDNKDDNDHKLLSLLDTLEQEVKHISLDGSEKDLFDAKIRKIYGSIVGSNALSKFPKSILLRTANQEIPEIDFGETKISDKLEPDHEEGNHLKDPDKPIQPKRYKIDQGIRRIKNHNPSIQGHKWKNKFIDSFDQKKYKENMDGFSNGDASDNKDNDNLDFTYGDINHKHMDDLDRKQKENLNKKYSENHLDPEYNDVQLKLSGNHQHHYELDRKYYDNEPVSKSDTKYMTDKAVLREFEHNPRSSQEDTTSRNFRFKDLDTIHSTPDIPLIAKDREKRKKNERKHRNRIKSLNSRKDPIDPLSLERRKYYQEKLDNIKRKLRNRRNRGERGPINERSVRRMQKKTRETARTRTKSLADNFYMPERARFLHGF